LSVMVLTWPLSATFTMSVICVVLPDDGFAGILHDHGAGVEAGRPWMYFSAGGT
jgi:hypothetical protein